MCLVSVLCFPQNPFSHTLIPQAFSNSRNFVGISCLFLYLWQFNIQSILSLRNVEGSCVILFMFLVDFMYCYCLVFKEHVWSGLDSGNCHYPLELEDFILEGILK